MAVDIQQHRAGDIPLRRKCYGFTDSGKYTAQVDTDVSSKSAFAKSSDCRLDTAQILFRFTDRG